jgi:hypothetical protein
MKYPLLFMFGLWIHLVGALIFFQNKPFGILLTVYGLVILVYAFIKLHKLENHTL